MTVTLSVFKLRFTFEFVIYREDYVKSKGVSAQYNFCRFFVSKHLFWKIFIPCDIYIMLHCIPGCMDILFCLQNMYEGQSISNGTFWIAFVLL